MINYFLAMITLISVLFCMYDTTEKNLLLKYEFTKYLERIFGFLSDYQFSFNCFPKYARERKISQYMTQMNLPNNNRCSHISIGKI